MVRVLFITLVILLFISCSDKDSNPLPSDGDTISGSDQTIDIIADDDTDIDVGEEAEVDTEAERDTLSEMETEVEPENKPDIDTPPCSEGDFEVLDSERDADVVIDDNSDEESDLDSESNGLTDSESEEDVDDSSMEADESVEDDGETDQDSDEELTIDDEVSEELPDEDEVIPFEITSEPSTDVKENIKYMYEVVCQTGDGTAPQLSVGGSDTCGGSIENSVYDFLLDGFTEIENCTMEIVCKNATEQIAQQILLNVVENPRMVKDINLYNSDLLPMDLYNVNGVLYFTATDTKYGEELWFYSAERERIELVKDINEGYESSSPENLIRMNDALYFVADDGVHGKELWKHQGGVTALVKDIFSGEEGAKFSPESKIVINNELFFTVNDGVNGYELWKSDGTEEGTALVKDINPLSEHSYPKNFAALGGILYFSADDGLNGYELWRSDGTAAGTYIVKNIDSGTYGSAPDNLTVWNSELYFAAKSENEGVELWKSDGTGDGTKLVFDINPGTGSSNPGEFTLFEGTLYFVADGGTQDPVEDVYDGGKGVEIWKTDGTTAELAFDILEGPASSHPGQLVAVHDTLYFIAHDLYYEELFMKYDGVNSPTLFSSNQYTLSDFGRFTVFTDKLISAAKEATSGDYLFVAIEKNNIVTAIEFGFDNSAFVSEVAAASENLFFTASGNQGQSALWLADQTFSDVRNIKDIYPVNGGSNPSSFANVDGALYFSADDGIHGRELWSSDGTEAGTFLLNDLVEGEIGSAPGSFVQAGDTLFFKTWKRDVGSELWVEDSSGMHMVTDLYEGHLQMV